MRKSLGVEAGGPLVPKGFSKGEAAFVELNTRFSVSRTLCKSLSKPFADALDVVPN